MHIEHKLVMQAFEVVSSLCHYRPNMMALSEDESCRCCFKWFRDDNTDVIHDFWFVLPEGLLKLEAINTQNMTLVREFPLPTSACSSRAS